MRVLLVPTGSHGDVHPFVGLGVGLKARGHEVHLLTAEPFRHLAADAGFDDFAPTVTADGFAAMIHDPNIWHPTRGLRAIFNPAITRPAIRAAYARIAERYRPGETVVVAGVLSHAARLAHETLGVPLATAHLQPMALYSVENPARYSLLKPRRLPRWGRRFVYRLGDRIIDRAAGPVLNEFRAELGLPRVRRLYGRWVNSPQLILGLFPEWFGSAPDWPPQTRLTGFVRYDQAESSDVPAEVGAFLKNGEPPVVFTFGSAMRQGGPYFAAAVEACRLLGRRGLLIARGKEQIPPTLPPTVLHAEYAPFSTVFPRAAVVVHHGGIGTCAQAMAAGVPQFVMPLAFDQPDNAERLQKLGVARWLPRRKFTPKRVAKVLRELLAMPREACDRVAKRMAEGDALREACEQVEGLRGKDVANGPARHAQG